MPDIEPIVDVEIVLFDYVLYYDGYGGVVDEPVPPGLIRVSNSKYVTRITEEQIKDIGPDLDLEISVRAACDNYDRIGNAYLSLVEKGKDYDNDNLAGKIEIARFITPFMDKNKQPFTVPYFYEIDNVAKLLNDSEMNDVYDFWIEFDIFGVPYAAQKQIEGCEGRNDTFFGTLKFVTTSEKPEDKSQALIPLAASMSFNNYKHTDIPGETVRMLDFETDQDIQNANLYVITSNHGANQGGEEYNRRDHFIYLDNELIDTYKPGGKSCEFFRKYNTQGNGIYSQQPRTATEWSSFSNWCPGDKIPIRYYNIGTLESGRHRFRIEVPDAEFVGGQGNIPLSVYIQGDLN